MSFIGMLQQGNAAKDQGEAQQTIAEFNARQKEREEKSRIEASEFEERRVAAKEKIWKANQRAMFSKFSVNITESSSMEMLAETAGQFQVERALTLRQGLIDANFLKSQASILRAQGTLAARLGQATRRASRWAAVGNILSMGASAYQPTSAPTDTSGAGGRASQPNYGSSGYPSFGSNGSYNGGYSYGMGRQIR